MIKYIFLIATITSCNFTIAMESKKEKSEQITFYICKVRKIGGNGCCKKEFSELGQIVKHLFNKHGITSNNAKKHYCIHNPIPSALK